MIVFDAPMWLLCALPVLVLGAVEWRRSRAGAAVRVALALVVCVAVAAPAWVGEPLAERVVYVVDRSASVPAAELERARAAVETARAGAPGPVVEFGGAAAVAVSGAGDRADSESPAAGTDLAGAVELALSLLPADRPGRLELWTDGRGNRGDLPRALSRLGDRAVTVVPHPLDPSRPGPALSELQLSRTVLAPGESVSVRVRGVGDGEELSVELDGRRLEGEETPPTLGLDATATLEWTCTIPADQPAGVGKLEVVGGSARIGAVVRIRPAPSVRLVADDPRDVRALGAVLQADGLRVSRQGAARALGDLDDVDVVVVANAPVAAGLGAPALAAGTARALDAFARAGGGVVVLGGDRAFDLGGYDGSPMEPLLPVKLRPQDPGREDAVTLAIVLDKSGSMAVRADGKDGMVDSVFARMQGGGVEGTKMALANEAAVASLERLRPVDRFGVMVVDTEVRWPVPLQPPEDVERLSRKVRATWASGGGMVLLDALAAARDGLAGADTPLRHVILFADASDAVEQKRGVDPASGEKRDAADIVDDLVADSVTLSIIGLGNQASRDVPYLRELAERGGGNFYLARRARDLKTFFVAETERLTDPSLVEERIRVQPLRWHAALRGVEWAGAPALRGHNAVEPRAGARLLLVSGTGAPLLASWRVGLGEVVAWTSDAGGRWASDWLGWPGYARLWTQIVRHLASTEDTRGATVAVRWVRGQPTLELTVRDEDGMSRGPTPMVATLDMDGGPIDVGLAPVGPGQWSAAVALRPGELVSVSVVDADGSAVLRDAVMLAPPPELRWRTADQETLRALAEAAGGIGDVQRPRRPLWPLFAWLALVLVPLDAWLRRALRAR